MTGAGRVGRLVETIVGRPISELRSDLAFFGTCGFAVGLLMVWRSAMEQKGLANGESWADAVFGDFVSMNAFAFVFVGLLGLGSLATILTSMGLPWIGLENVVAHVEVRLAQLASSVVSFTVGVSLAAPLHSVYAGGSSGVLLALWIALFDVLLLGGLLIAGFVARRDKPWHRWEAALVALLLSLIAAGWLLVRGVDELG